MRAGSDSAGDDPFSGGTEHCFPSGVFLDHEVFLDRVPTVHVRGGSAIRRPLTVLAVCAVVSIGYLARDFLIPTAAAVVLALILTPVANTAERIRFPASMAAAVAVVMLTLTVAGLLALAIPSISSWLQQAPFLTYSLQQKLERLSSSLAFMQELTSRLEFATSAATAHAVKPPEKVVMQEHSLLGELATATPGVVLQIAYTEVLAFILLAHRNSYRRQVMRVPRNFATRVRLARVMRDINDRVGHYLLSLIAIYAGVALLATITLAMFGFPNALMWGICMGLASFVPFIGAPTVVALVAVVGLLSFDDWRRILAAPAALAVIHVTESQLVTPAFVSRRCALNTVAVFVTIALLGWMWGAVGAIVAVPLLILISTIAAHLPSLHWLEVLLADDRPSTSRFARPPLASAPFHQMRHSKPVVQLRPQRRRRTAK